MRIHLTNFIGRMGLVDEGGHTTPSDEEVEYLDRPTKHKTEHTAPRIGSKRNSADYANTFFIHTEPKRIRQSPTIQNGQPEKTARQPSSPPPSSPPPNRRIGEATPDTGK